MAAWQHRNQAINSVTAAAKISAASKHQNKMAWQKHQIMASAKQAKRNGESNQRKRRKSAKRNKGEGSINKLMASKS